MAALINRIMSGENQFRTNDIRTDNSPLQIFVKAKKKINDIFIEINDYVEDTTQFIGLLRENNKIIEPKEIQNVESYNAKVQGIRDVLKRDHMKVAFFGRTSNGKSTVINAMLRNKILPSGIGHTTNCFLQVEGSENGEAYLITEVSDVKQPVQSVGQLGHALCKEKLCESNLVRIFWPKDKCLLLRDDVVFVDSPGVDVTPNLDEWIDKHCLDADVFVLVANAESTLMIAEKNFFHKVSTRLSKPNIFILMNRWDASAAEPEFYDEQVDVQKEVRAQHQDRSVDFLVKELKVCNPKDAEERVFFISAKETLQARIQEQKDQPIHNVALADGFQKRYFEFQDFERKFEECISKSAVKTKFEKHSQKGKLIVTEIRQTLDEILDRTQKMKFEQEKKKKEVYNKINFIENQLVALTQEMKEKIHRIVEDVEQKVSKALNEEIRRLSVLINEFNVPFHIEPLALNIYKRELHVHVERGLGSNLRARLSTALALNIDNSQREMIEKMSALLPEKKQQACSTILPKREAFQVFYRLNCDNLCADFHEDLEFRFSWGLKALINKFARKQNKKLAITHLPQEIPAIMSPTDSVDSSKFVSTPNCFPAATDDWPLATKVAIASITSQGTMGGLLIVGFMLKTIGWRLIALTGGIYGALYLYERLIWTNKAKEQVFKKQYVEHATKKLKLIVDLTSSNCSYQVQQELLSTFARLCHFVDETVSEMDKETQKINATLHSLEEAGTKAKVLRNKANYLANELDLFDSAYLKSLI
ncbi:PREDICTED: transmembrane GTPase Marf isoform X1 [Ceratosolen solmsi marchali]|uniref:Transmembrane GTPase Marf isoform X1 n=1 Tax=Ceratosolen solmsi marchali TaxID=326594 RepID=A0AAJ6YMI0_9HYME|nr:PREDICTED: transmembrane GTPase Marf isoform X1 [Ceratosolen solmsi marchali]XP_011500794.1 PREDICTED: transmembrane GTPase Marf isoform X1 [Ceratosolen solmsi marchali]XP_011500795.1 PREDICTED: transmembrane GTPase Marf isoform X1 [Ceratosolen solmsi marchali]